MTGSKQRVLDEVITLLNKLGKMPPQKPKNETLFQEITGYDWEWSGQEWVKELIEIKARYEKESHRVRNIQTRGRVS